MGRVFKVLRSIAAHAICQLRLSRADCSACACHGHATASLQDPYGQINSIDFHRTQDYLVAGHDEGKITVYNTYEGKKLAALDCSKYGVAHVTYTHHSRSLLHASTKVRDICKDLKLSCDSQAAAVLSSTGFEGPDSTRSALVRCRTRHLIQRQNMQFGTSAIMTTRI
jgi:WD40 repeat protein